MLMVSILQWRNICSYWKYHLLPPVFKWINNDKNNHTYKNVMIYINRYMSIPQRKCRLQLWSILAWLTKLYLPLLLKIWIHKVIPFSYKMQGFLEYYNLVYILSIRVGKNQIAFFSKIYLCHIRITTFSLFLFKWVTFWEIITDTIQILAWKAISTFDILYF